MQFDEGLLFINIYIFTYSLNTLYKFLPIPYVRPSARTSDQLPMTLHRLNNKYPMIALNAFPIETLLFTFLHFGTFCLINLFCFFFSQLFFDRLYPFSRDGGGAVLCGSFCFSLFFALCTHIRPPIAILFSSGYFTDPVFRSTTFNDIFIAFALLL